jgi:hypothetical protein
MNPLMVNPTLSTNSKASRALAITMFTLIIFSMQTVQPIYSAQAIQATAITIIIQAQPDQIMEKVVGLAVGLFATAYLLPPAVGALANASFTNVNAGVVAILQTVVPIMAGIAITLLFVRSVRGS